MKLNRNFINYNAGKESLLVPTGEADCSGIVKGNKTLGAILSLLEKDMSEQELLSALQARFDAPAEVIAGDVRHALTELRKIGALDE